jgi:hypothetical protein
MMNDVSTNFCANTGSAGSALNSSTFTGGKYLDSPYWMPRKKRRGKQLDCKKAQYATTAASFDLTTCTLSAWVKWRGGIATIIGQNTTGAQLRINANGSIEFLKANIASITTTAVNTVKVDSWEHVSCTFNGSICNIYVNGVFVKTATNAQTLNNLPLVLGNSVAAPQPFSGLVDDARIYNRVLTPEEHYQLYLDNAPRDGLLVEYKFDRRNMLNWSEDLSNAVWSAAIGFPTVTATSFARTITGPCYLGYPLTKDDKTTAMTAYAEVKAGTATHHAMRLQGTYPNRVDAVTNLVTGVTNFSLNGTAVLLGSSVVALADGWYGVTLAWLSDATTAYSILHSFNSNASKIDGTDSIATSSGYIRKTQLDLGPSATPYEKREADQIDDTSGNGFHGTPSGISAANYVQSY